jgi:hypothetical protein
LSLRALTCRVAERVERDVEAVTLLDESGCDETRQHSLDGRYVHACGLGRALHGAGAERDCREHVEPLLVREQADQLCRSRHDTRVADRSRSCPEPG